MTCIVGLVHEREVYMASDSGRFSGSGVVLRGGTKLAASSPYIFGSSGSCRVADVLRHEFKPPHPIPAVPDLHEYMAITFTRMLREAFKKAACLHVENGCESISDSTILVGVSGQLFIVDSNLGVSSAIEGFAAIGSGQRTAEGVVYDLTTHERGSFEPEEIVVRAAKAAGHLIDSVSGPFFKTNTRDYLVKEVAE